MQRKRRLLDTVFFPVLIAGAAACAVSAPAAGFRDREIRVQGEPFTYQVFLPASWTAEKSWPIVMFLHGAGERGTDGVAHTRVGLPRLLRRWPDFEAVVVMPQCPRGTWWGQAEVEERVYAALEDALQTYRGDPERVYLTGLSLGGYGTWAFGFKYPGKFAALVPVCGGVAARSRIPPPPWHPAALDGDAYAATARAIGKTPVWAFHGEADRVIPVSESRRLVEALRALGGDVRYTEYEGVGHNSWDQAYAEPELWEWLFRLRLAR